LPIAKYGHKSSKERVGWESGVRIGHRVTSRDESGVLVAAQKTMQEKTALSKHEHDLTASNIVERAGRDLRDIARPQGGQHAFAANLQTKLPGAAQSLYG
jgi:hypothetical protein